jgi:hypothetical protein
MSLTADITALTGLFDEQKAQLATHPKIIRLSKKEQRTGGENQKARVHQRPSC